MRRAMRRLFALQLFALLPSCESMPESPLLDRQRRMQREIERGEDSFERKLRYLLWLN